LVVVQIFLHNFSLVVIKCNLEAPRASQAPY
jgi:hypothetical protein